MLRKQTTRAEQAKRACCVRKNRFLHNQTPRAAKAETAYWAIKRGILSQQKMRAAQPRTPQVLRNQTLHVPKANIMWNQSKHSMLQKQTPHATKEIQCTSEHGVMRKDMLCNLTLCDEQANSEHPDDECCESNTACCTIIHWLLTKLTLRAAQAYTACCANKHHEL
jgi:hypothetical protein